MSPDESSGPPIIVTSFPLALACEADPENTGATNYQPRSSDPQLCCLGYASHVRESPVTSAGTTPSSAPPITVTSSPLHLPSHCTTTPTSSSAAETLHLPPRGSPPPPVPSPLTSPSCVPHVRDFRLQTANGRLVGVLNRVSGTARATSVAGGGGWWLCSSAFVSSVRVTVGAASVATGSARRGRRTE